MFTCSVPVPGLWGRSWPAGSSRWLQQAMVHLWCFQGDPALNSHQGIRIAELMNVERQIQNKFSVFVFQTAQTQEVRNLTYNCGSELPGCLGVVCEVCFEETVVYYLD